MNRKTIVVALLTFMLLASQAAAGDLNRSIREAASKEAAAQSSTRPMRSSSSYFASGLAAFGVGGPLVIYGALKAMEGACNGPADAKVDCGRGRYPAMIGAGAALVGVGGLLMWKSSDHGSSAELVPQVGGVELRARVRW